MNPITTIPILKIVFIIFLNMVNPSCIMPVIKPVIFVITLNIIFITLSIIEIILIIIVRIIPRTLATIFRIKPTILAIIINKITKIIV